MTPKTLLSLWMLSALFFVFSPAAQATKPASTKTTSRPLYLWKIKGKRNTVYLFGSIHVLGKGFYPLDAKIEKAFASSPVLVVEADVLNISPMKVRMHTLRHGMYPPGKTLKSELSAKVYKKVAAHLKKRGMPLARLQRMKPWLLGMTLSMIELRRLGFSGEQGLDKYFLRRMTARIAAANAKALAKKGKKKKGKAAPRPAIKELEGVLLQVKIFSSFSPKVQEAILASALLPAATVKSRFEKLVNYWKTGADKKLEKIAFADFKKAPPVFMDKMVRERNVGMTNKVMEYLKSDKDHFVVMGTAHLLGKDSVLRMLRARKVKLQRLKGKASGHTLKSR